MDSRLDAPQFLLKALKCRKFYGGCLLVVFLKSYPLLISSGFCRFLRFRALASMSVRMTYRTQSNEIAFTIVT
jgi:hypothetical protein